MTTRAELIAEQLMNANINNKTWGDVIYNVKAYGASGDGSTDDTTAFQKAITAASGKAVLVPPGTYKLTSMLTIPADTVIVGTDKRTCKLLHSYNGDMFTLAEGAGLMYLTLEGQGATYTGRGVVMSGEAGRQYIFHARLLSFEGAPVEFTTTTCGSQSIFFDVEATRVNAATGSGKFAVNMASGFQNGAVPRKFIAIETSGTPSFNFGGCNDVFVSDSFLADLAYTSDSRGVIIIGSRISNQTALTIDGHGNTITGCTVLPKITIAPGADSINIGNNTYNNPGFIDNSGNGRNQLTHSKLSYTPTLSSGGTAPVLGNGTITAEYSRSGAQISVSIEMVLGSTTTLGTGDIRFSLPHTPSPVTNQVCGSMMMLRGSTVYTGVSMTVAGFSYVTFYRDTTGSVTFNSPATFVAGDIIRTTFTYLT